MSLGNKTLIVDTYGGQHDAQYRVMPLQAIMLNPVFARDDRTPSEGVLKAYDIAKGFDAQQMISLAPIPHTGPPVLGHDWAVEAGTARVNALRFLRDMGEYSRYKAPLAANADQYGIDPAEVEAMPEPTLVRMRQSELHGQAARLRFAKLANVSPDYYQGKLQQIRDDAARWGDLGLALDMAPGDSLASSLNLKSNRDKLMSYIGSMDVRERQGMVDVHPEGGPMLTPYGAKRIQTALLAHVLTDPQTVFELSEGIPL
jgi:hypothetical protein